MFLIAQIVGVIGIFFNILIYQQKQKESLLVHKLLSDMVSLLHFLMLGAFSGALIACIGCFRELTFLKCSKDSPKGKIMLIIFIIVSLVSAAVSWKGFFSILPTIASVISVISFYQGDPKITRILSFPISMCMGTYCFFVKSYTGIINEVLTVMSSILGIIRHDASKKIINKDLR